MSTAQPDHPVRIGILSTIDDVAALAAQLHLPIAHDDADFDLLLELTPDRLQLRQPRSKLGPVYCDFIEGAVGYRRRNPQAQAGLLKRAIGWRRTDLPGVVDATAGLGRDAVMLASLGCAVTAVERSPIIAALLRDGLERAAHHDSAFRAPRLVEADARRYLASLDGDHRPDVVYLDPMFPHRGKSAAVKKEMIVCRLAAGDDGDAGELLAAALAAARNRVVVKRPLRAAALEGPAPSHAIRGSSVRFDVYLRR